MTFPTARLGRRGFEEEPVLRFLRAMHAEFLLLVSERASLWQEVQRLRGRILAGVAGSDLHPPLRAADPRAHTVRMPPAEPVTSGDVVLATAGNGQVAQARRRRDDFIEAAQLQADQLLEEAHARARQAAVSALGATAAPRTDQERLADRAELAYLRSYSDVYRAHLRAYIERVLQSVEEREHEGTAHPGAPPQRADHRGTETNGDSSL